MRTPLLFMMTMALAGSGQAQKLPDLTEISLEQLLEIEVTSVSKREQKLSRSAASIHVITQEDIRRSTATSIPELLRSVPGVNVSRIDANKWAISIRGFHDRFATKLLVLIDGRSVYTPLFSGVFWEVQDTLLQDIERIEVIRGPGASLWGANAVSGVINIITKNAHETRGGLLSAGGGNVEHANGAVRYGASAGKDVDYRVYAKYFDHGRHPSMDRGPGSDDWNSIRGGFRLDKGDPRSRALTISGEVYDGSLNQVLTRPLPLPPFTRDLADRVRFSGSNLLASWKQKLSDANGIKLYGYHDRTNRRGHLVEEVRDTFEAGFEHQLTAGERHEILWGFGDRVTHDALSPNRPVSFTSASRTDHLLNAFVQDEIRLLGERLILTLGTKLERNDYTGFEFQPSARILWAPNDQHALWGAVSRAVRTPSRAEHDVMFDLSAAPLPNGLTQIFRVVGNPLMQSEKLLAHELGYRVKPARRLSIDASVFYHRFDDLRTVELGQTSIDLRNLPPLAVTHLEFGNGMLANNIGGEVYASVSPTGIWRVSAGYAALRTRFRQSATSLNLSSLVAGDNPKHRFLANSWLKLAGNLELDTYLALNSGLDMQKIPRYTSLDVRVGWKPSEMLELSVGLTNLVHDNHVEFGRTQLGENARRIPRAAYGKFTWRF